MLFLDLETRSQVDLIKNGLMRYAQHQSTQDISMAYTFDDDVIKFWWARDEEGSPNPFPQEVIDYFNTGGPIFAHNADFERALFDYVIAPDYDFDAPALTQWRCTMATALANGFAAGLDTATQQAGVPYAKHAAGTRLIREYCAPEHKDIFLAAYAEDRKLMKDYNMLDVECMRALTKCCRPLTATEWEEYHLTCRINERGIPIDRTFSDAALGYADFVAQDASRNIAKRTGGKMTKHTQRVARDEWLELRLTDAQKRLLVIKKDGVEKHSFDADHRQYLLACDDLNPEARELIEHINEAGSSVLRKYAVAHNQNVGGRVHGTFLWNGAGRTGRFSGKGLQPHNIRRDVFEGKEAQAYIQQIVKQGKVDNPAGTLARLLRAMIESKTGLTWVDWSSIEGRVAPWLANSGLGEAKLNLYRAKKDVYVVTAADMFGMEEAFIDEPHRQAGKIAELALQFGGGTNALLSMAKNYGVTFDDDVAGDMVRDWRRVNPWAEQIWGLYQSAINDAVQCPGEEFPVGRVVYQSDGNLFLWCRLPSERLLSYPFPQWEPYFTPWDEERMGATFQTHFKPAPGKPPLRTHARGALMFQNTVQAVAADLLREALLEADDSDLPIIGHIHDEIILEGGQAEGDQLNKIMLENPWWAGGLPIATGGVKTGTRYGK